MKTMTITRFKAQALAAVDEVATDKVTVIITKHGKPVAQVSPYQGTATRHRPGRLAGLISFEKDIVSPLGAEPWEASR